MKAQVLISLALLSLTSAANLVKRSPNPIQLGFDNMRALASDSQIFPIGPYYYGFMFTNFYLGTPGNKIPQRRGTSKVNIRTSPNVGVVGIGTVGNGTNPVYTSIPATIALAPNTTMYTSFIWDSFWVACLNGTVTNLKPIPCDFSLVGTLPGGKNFAIGRIVTPRSNGMVFVKTTLPPVQRVSVRAPDKTVIVLDSVRFISLNATSSRVRAKKT